MFRSCLLFAALLSCRSAGAVTAPAWLVALRNFAVNPFRAVPPDLTSTTVNGPLPVQSNVPVLTAALQLVDRATSAAEAAIPGLAQQLAVLQAAEQGPFKLSTSISVAPQIRISVGRLTLGLPNSKGQILKWLEDPTLQLRTDTLEVRSELYLQVYYNYNLIDPPYDPVYQTPFILSRRKLHAQKNDSVVSSSHGDLFHGRRDASQPYAAIEMGGVERGRALIQLGAIDVPQISDCPVNHDCLQLIASKIKATLRSTISDFLNLRPQFRALGQAEVLPIARFGEQYQQRDNGQPVVVQKYGRFGFEAGIGLRAPLLGFQVVTKTDPSFVAIPANPWPTKKNKTANALQLIAALNVTAQHIIAAKLLRWDYSTGTVVAPRPWMWPRLRKAAPVTPPPSPPRALRLASMPSAASSPWPEPAVSQPSEPAVSSQESEPAVSSQEPEPAVSQQSEPGVRRRSLMQSAPTNVAQAANDTFALNAPLLFPGSLLNQWYLFFYDWQQLFGVGNLFDLGLWEALLAGPYSKQTQFVISPQFRVYLGQVKWGTPRSKNETEQWLKDATLFYRTIEQSYQLNLRLEFDLNVRLLPLVPSSPPPLPPFPAKNDWPIRRLLNETSAASSPPPLPTPPPSPSPPPWHSNDEACAASHFPVLYDREPVLRARALSGNGKVSPNVWLNVMQSFYHGLQELRTAHVPLDCVPPALRDQAAAEAVAQTIMETPPSNTSAGRKLLQNLAFDAGVLAELVQSALDARQLAVLDHQQALLKDLFVTAQKSLFGTAIFEAVVAQFFEIDPNLSNPTQPFFPLPTLPSQFQLNAQFIAGAEDLLKIVAAPPPPGARPSPGAGATRTNANAPAVLSG